MRRKFPRSPASTRPFIAGQPYLAQAFALPRRFADAGVRRYGFHGLSYEYLVARFGELAPTLANARIVIAHLGNGASMCAVKDGRSVATTMGFTAVDGLMMGTRCGALDPGVILYVMQEHGMDAAAIEDLIYRQSGLLGVSGISSDMRALRASAEPAAREAIALFVYRIVRELDRLVAALGGIDALVFSGGIGEHDAMTRAEVVKGRDGSAPSSIRIAIPVATSDQRRRLGCFGLGGPDRRGAAHRAPHGGGFVVRATIIVIVMSIWEMFRRTGCPDDHPPRISKHSRKSATGIGAGFAAVCQSLALDIAVLEVGDRSLPPDQRLHCADEAGTPAAPPRENLTQG